MIWWIFTRLFCLFIMHNLVLIVLLLACCLWSPFPALGNDYTNLFSPLFAKYTRTYIYVSWTGKLQKLHDKPSSTAPIPLLKEETNMYHHRLLTSADELAFMKDMCASMSMTSYGWNCDGLYNIIVVQYCDHFSGVTCASLVVTSISLPSSAITGTIPPSIGSLSVLETFGKKDSIHCIVILNHYKIYCSRVYMMYVSVQIYLRMTWADPFPPQ